MNSVRIIPDPYLLILLKYFADPGRATKVEVLRRSRAGSRILSGQFCYVEC
jgi:hypothetical protein